MIARLIQFSATRQLWKRSFQYSTRVEGLQKVAHYPRFSLTPEKHGEWFSLKQVEIYQQNLQNGQKADKLFTLTGRIQAKRESSAKLIFYDLIQNGQVFQVVASRTRFEGTPEEFEAANRGLSRGDIVSFTGVPGKTNHGQLSLFSTREIKLLSPCLQSIPRQGLKDPRYLDLLVNQNSVDILKTRSKVIRYIRDFLDQRDFLEVETPVLSGHAGGASARPFETRAHALGLPMQLRIAPELYLKQLVIGGMDRVFELGKQFRNEGIDADHNPEFTTCEFYQAYGNLESLMKDTECLLSGMTRAIRGNQPVLVSGQPIDFHSPFRKIDVSQSLAELFGCSLQFLEEEDALEQLVTRCRSLGITVSEPTTVPRILDHLISTHIEPRCTQPTFLYHHPLALSPLAKDALENGQRVAARFELFVMGKEIVNAYEELNDPKEQRKRFRAQMKDRELGDLESPLPDMHFCDALEYGLPPTAGWGMGVDRVVQLMTGASHIREVLAFPIMRPAPQPTD